MKTDCSPAMKCGFLAGELFYARISSSWLQFAMFQCASFWPKIQALGELVEKRGKMKGVICWLGSVHFVKYFDNWARHR